MEDKGLYDWLLNLQHKHFTLLIDSGVIPEETEQMERLTSLKELNEQIRELGTFNRNTVNLWDEYSDHFRLDYMRNLIANLIPDINDEAVWKMYFSTIINVAHLNWLSDKVTNLEKSELNWLIEKARVNLEVWDKKIKEPEILNELNNKLGELNESERDFTDYFKLTQILDKMLELESKLTYDLDSKTKEELEEYPSFTDILISY